MIHENSFELTKEFSVRKGETCRSPSFDGSAAVSPLCGAPFQGTPFFMRAAFTSIRMLIREKRQKCDFASF